MTNQEFYGIEFDPATWPTQPGEKTLAIILDLMDQAHSKGMDDGFADAQGCINWEYGWAGDSLATTFYDTREEAEEFMSNPKQFKRTGPGEWVEVEA